MKKEYYYCDKCGKEIKDLANLNRLGKPSNGSYEKFCELCPSCFDDLFSFIKK